MGDGTIGDDEQQSALELLAIEAYGDAAVEEVIRPAAVLPEHATRSVLAELALRDVRAGGHWLAEPTVWRRYDRPWRSEAPEADSTLVGTLQVVYGAPTRYEITVYRATITTWGAEHGWTVSRLCDEAFGFGGLDLSTCPRADLTPPPRPFRLR